jgi:tetratricopeptide (TPR) repeat protein
MTSRWAAARRAALALLAAVGLVLFVWLSVQVYRSKKDPESFRAWDGPYAWIVGPPAKSLTAAASDRVQAGLESLEDTSRPAPERIRLYRAELERAEKLLIRSLRAQPAQAGALASLAAVRWELDPPVTPEAVQKHLDMIALASRMAPTFPDVQRDLGELLLKMGRRDEALGYLARTVELDPRHSREVVQLLEDYLFTADEMFEALPRRAHVVAYLERPYLTESRQADYLELLEDALGSGIDPLLLTRYGNACLRLGRADRLLDRMDAFGELAEVEAEAERLKQRARALVVLQEPALAIEAATRARQLQPEVPHRAETLGDVALGAGEHATAEAAYRDSLRLLARAKAGAVVRARLYRKIGQVEEDRGKPDRAYDAYRRALELNPAEPHARKRVAAMERAAGFE